MDTVSNLTRPFRVPVYFVKRYIISWTRLLRDGKLFFRQAFLTFLWSVLRYVTDHDRDGRTHTTPIHFRDSVGRDDLTLVTRATTSVDRR